MEREEVPHTVAAPEVLEFRILGPLEVLDDAGPLAISRPQALCLLGVLLVHANEVVPLERLIDELWPAEPPARAQQAVQELIYQLRRVLERGQPRGGVIAREGNGYRLVVGGDQLDLQRFTRLVKVAEEARRSGDSETAAWTLREALGLWRGEPFANVPFESSGGLAAEARWLVDLRLNVLIKRIELDLELGEEGDLVAELERLASEHPLDERLRALLMIALYRAGRQTDALRIYQEARSLLVEEQGIEPSKRLQALQQAILRHDPELERTASPTHPETAASLTGDRVVVVGAPSAEALDALVAVGSPLARSQIGRELIIALIAEPDATALTTADSIVRRYREKLLVEGIDVRATAFTSATPPSDLVRLASRENVDLLLLGCPAIADDGRLDQPTTTVLAEAPCDVVLVAPRTASADRVVVPFGGHEHDWAALEIGAWLAAASESGLTLLGVTSSDGSDRDSSRLLSDASLLVQHYLGIQPELALVESAPNDFLHSCEEAGSLVMGLPERWRAEGLGTTRLTLLRNAPCRVLLVRRGTRPGGIAPRETATVFAWSLLDARR